ncbi:hypothetical protein HPB49_026648 [Dermacentor silvarum]|nr:hypothetical protein HPB49_026648 [Dermacentor silvarum]
MMRQRNVEELWSGWAPSADNQQLWLRTPFTESGIRVDQRTLPLISEMACANYQPPVSQTASIAVSPLELEELPLELQEELASFEQLWASFTDAWFCILQEPTYSLGAWPTLNQVIKLLMQSVVADYIDERANFSQESTIWQTPYSVTRSQEWEESDSDTQLLDLEIPQWSASLSGWQKECSPTTLPSRGEHCEFSPPEQEWTKELCRLSVRVNIPEILKNTGSSGKKPSMALDLDQTLQGKSTELAPDNFGKVEANVMESRNPAIKTQREAQPSHNPLVECEMPLLYPSLALSQEASKTKPQNREISEQTGDQAASTKQSSKESILSGYMEHPSSIEVALHTVAQRSDECILGYDVGPKGQEAQGRTGQPLELQGSEQDTGISRDIAEPPWKARDGPRRSEDEDLRDGLTLGP